MKVVAKLELLAQVMNIILESILKLQNGIIQLWSSG